MRNFKNLEIIDSLLPQGPSTFESAYEEHEKNLLTFFDNSIGCDALNHQVFETARRHAGTTAQALSEKELAKLLDSKSVKRADEVHFFRSYLLGKRAQEIHLREKIINNEIAWTLLYKAGVHLGQALAAKKRLKREEYFRNLANTQNASSSKARARMIELIVEKRPPGGWETKEQMIDCITNDLNKFIKEQGIPLGESNAHERNLKWTRKYPEIRVTYEQNTEKYLNLLKKIIPIDTGRYDSQLG